MIRCDYCNQPAELVTGRTVYPHRPDLFHKMFWVCHPCDARVGCHAKGSGREPLGRLANAELRAAKVAAHSAFDPLWRGAKNHKVARTTAYQWLARRMGLAGSQCHIGMFTVEQCQRVVEVCRANQEAMP